jgi:hypothetical protein
VSFALLVVLALAASASALTLTADPAMVDDTTGQVSIDISVDVSVIQFDLHAAYDTSYWTLNDILGADVVEHDDTQGFLNDVFGDVGLGDPIAPGATLFTLVFDVVGSPTPGRTVLEVGNLSNFNAYFDRTVLLADESYNIHTPNADRSENAIVVTPEPTTAVLFLLGLTGLATFRLRER